VRGFSPGRCQLHAGVEGYEPSTQALFAAGDAMTGKSRLRLATCLGSFIWPVSEREKESREPAKFSWVTLATWVTVIALWVIVAQVWPRGEMLERHRERERERDSLSIARAA